MSKINALCVYCGSSPGTDPAFVETARSFGKILAENNIRLVYGGGSTGLMGAVAEAVLKNGGDVTGIIPEFLTNRERPRRLAQELIVTRDMHERKAKMFERADGFVALPGGIGTLEELFEAWTGGYLGVHDKPVVMLDPIGHFDELRAWLNGLLDSGYVSQFALDRLVVVDEVRAAMAACAPS